jgi:hypothetical protein
VERRVEATDVSVGLATEPQPRLAPIVPSATQAKHAAVDEAKAPPPAHHRGAGAAATTTPATSVVTTIPSAPPRRDVLPISLTKDGRLANDAQLERVERAAASATDCFLFCHGWLYDEAEARQEAARFFALLDGAMAPVRERAVPLRLGLHWPSKAFADAALTRDAVSPGLWPDLERRIARRVGGRVLKDSSGLARLLSDLCAAEIPASPEEELELDMLARRLRDAERGRGLLPISPFQAFSFWVMKRRAGEVGERFGREQLSPLWTSLKHRPRLHLIGHSFGAKLVTSIVLGGVRPDSVTLLLAAFSAFAFAPEIPRYGRPGFYHRVLAERMVNGPIVVLRSDHDRALGTLYSAITGGGQVDRRRTDRPARASNGGRGGSMRTTVATSALGAVGARGVGAPEVELVQTQQIGLPQFRIVNVDGSRVVNAQDFLLGAHRDIFHREVATLIALSAGVLVGGPDGVRPRPRDPFVSP